MAVLGFPLEFYTERNNHFSGRSQGHLSMRKKDQEVQEDDVQCEACFCTSLACKVFENCTAKTVMMALYCAMC